MKLVLLLTFITVCFSYSIKIPANEYVIIRGNAEDYMKTIYESDDNLKFLRVGTDLQLVCQFSTCKAFIHNSEIIKNGEIDREKFNNYLIENDLFDQSILKITLDNKTLSELPKLSGGACCFCKHCCNCHNSMCCVWWDCPTNDPCQWCCKGK